MTNEESNKIHLIAAFSLITLGYGTYILLDPRIKNADFRNDKLAFGLIIASFVPLLVSLSLIIAEFRHKGSQGADSKTKN